jgi:hypothetical protein
MKDPYCLKPNGNGEQHHADQPNELYAFALKAGVLPRRHRQFIPL